MQPSKPSSRRRPSSLAGKIALVTGGSQGIGLAIAKALAQAGCSVILTGRHQDRLAKAARDLRLRPGKVLTAVCDIRDPSQVKAMISGVRVRFRRVDILINNAGVSHANVAAADLPFAAWREVIETNLTGTFLVTQAALPLMKSGSAIVNNLSVAAKRVFPGASAYSASKHGALGFTNTLREELRPRGIRVIALLAGATDTAIWDAFWPDAPRQKMMSAASVADSVVNALVLPENTVMEEITLRPAAGTL